MKNGKKRISLKEQGGKVESIRVQNGARERKKNDTVRKAGSLARMQVGRKEGRKEGGNNEHLQIFWHHREE